MDSLPEYVFNFVRKAMVSQLPTLHNLKLWNCSSANLCPSCGMDQTNKHVLSHCGSPAALAQYTDRHNKVLEIMAKWILTHIEGTKSHYCDLRVPGARHVWSVTSSMGQGQIWRLYSPRGLWLASWRCVMKPTYGTRGSTNSINIPTWRLPDLVPSNTVLSQPAPDISKSEKNSSTIN